jgi:pimeloyl-ACP methyl ester carboxylesterase
MFPGETNWSHSYGPLVEAGYRVLSLDHRGHGRGLRPARPFRLIDAASDAAALLRTLEVGPVVTVGFSMGGAIAQLAAAAYPDLVSGLVLCGTSLHWTDPRDRMIWRGMALLQFWLRLFPRPFWAWLTARVYPDDEQSAAWLIGELGRNSPHDLAEAGRELGRFDSRSWIRHLRQPVAVVCTAYDRLVPPRNQREIASLVPGATLHEIEADHDAPVREADLFTGAVLQALESVRARLGFSARKGAAPAERQSGS